jgi:hypothetical protein
MKIAKLSARLRSLAQQCSSEASFRDRRNETALALRSVALQCAQTARALDNGLGYYRAGLDLLDRATDDLVEAAMQRVTDLAIDAVIHG